MTSKQKSVKVYARVLDPESGHVTLRSVGKSHPGEIRMMRKKGLAEWVDGKVILNLIPVKVRPLKRDDRDSIVADLKSRATAAGESFSPEGGVGAGRFRPQSFTPDPETGEPVPTENVSPRPIENVCSTALEWFEVIAAERNAGNSLYATDDPMRRMLGFVSDESNSVWYLGLRHIRAMTSEDTEPMIQFGLSHDQVKECIRTEKGRGVLLDTKDPIYDRSPMKEIFGEIPEIESGTFLEGLLSREVIIRSDSEVEEQVDSPFWDTVISDLSGRKSKTQDDHDSPRHMTGSVAPILPYSLRDEALEPSIRRGYKVLNADPEPFLIPESSNELQEDLNLEGWTGEGIDEVVFLRDRKVGMSPESDQVFFENHRYDPIPWTPAVWSEIDADKLFTSWWKYLGRDLEPLAEVIRESHKVHDFKVVFRIYRKKGQKTPIRIVGMAVRPHGTEWGRKNWVLFELNSMAFEDRERGPLSVNNVNALLLMVKRARLHLGALTKIPESWKKSSVPEKGWAQFRYPEDRARVPLITPDGKEYGSKIRGTFRRKGTEVDIRTEDGKEFTATMKKWLSLDNIRGYVVPKEFL